MEERRLLAVDLPAVLNIDTNRNGIMDVPEIQALSQSLDSGTYVFRRLDSGFHHVRAASGPNEIVGLNETIISLDFRGSVSGVKWDDLNANGLREPAEPGVPGVRIFADVNSDGVFNDGEPFTVTGADGTYQLVLPAGIVAIREVTPPGTVQTFPLGGVQQAALAPRLNGQTLSATISFDGVVRHNAVRPADVNADGDVTVVDAYFIVQAWREGGWRSLAGEAEGGSSALTYVDVNGDGFLGIADLWAVVDVLRGEGEPTVMNDGPGQQSPDPFTVSANSSQNTLPVLANDQGVGRLTLTGLGTLAGGIVGTSTQGDQGGQIVIQAGGAQTSDVVSYTPRPDFYGIERFIYEVRDEADGRMRRAEVSVRVVPDRDYASFTIQAFRTDGVTPVNSVELGEEFIVRVFVKDDRNLFTPTANRGVFSAFLDLAYDESRVDLVEVSPAANPHGFARDVRFSPQYQELVSVDRFAPGLIDEIGGTQTNGFEVNTQPLGPNAIPFFDARFRATSTGPAAFSTDRADDPEHQFIFFRPSNLEALDPQFIDFGQLNLTVTPPVGAVPDSFIRNEDLAGPPGSSLTNPILDVLANDVPFVAGQPLRIAGLGPNDAQTLTTAAGTLQIINNGQAVQFTPVANFNGVVNFTYRATDGVRSETAAVSLTVAPLNDAPVANDDDFTADNEALLTIPAPGVLANDTDPDGETLQVTAFQATSDLGAAVSVNSNGGFTYDPTTSAQLQGLEPGEVLIDTFTYTVSDGSGGQDSATVRIFVSRNTGGSHIVEIVAGQDTPNINFGNTRLQAEGELDVILGEIAGDVAAAWG